MRNIVVLMLFINLFFVSVCLGNNKIEISSSEAIKMASVAASKAKHDTSSSDVEVLKVKDKIEKGPLRLVWLANHFRDIPIDVLVKQEYWIILFYPKGNIENSDVLGGEYCVLVDLYSGKVIASYGSK